jgi:hypothetical protein
MRFTRTQLEVELARRTEALRQDAVHAVETAREAGRWFAFAWFVLGLGLGGVAGAVMQMYGLLK